MKWATVQRADARVRGLELFSLAYLGLRSQSLAPPQATCIRPLRRRPTLHAYARFAGVLRYMHTPASQAFLRCAPSVDAYFAGVLRHAFLFTKWK